MGKIVIFGTGTELMVYLALFYPFRMLSMHIGHWPIPDYQTFRYPGFPSIFIPYEQTNDFYFSGHTGLCTILLMFFFLHFKQRILAYFGGFLLVLTMYMLVITRGHYFNDILFGFLTAMIGIRYGYFYRFDFHYWTLNGYTKVFGLFEGKREKEIKREKFFDGDANNQNKAEISTV